MSNHGSYEQVFDAPEKAIKRRQSIAVLSIKKKFAS